MREYVYIFRGGAPQADLSDEEMRDHLERWMAWVDALEERGHLVSRGRALDDEARLIAEEGVVPGGPYAEATEVIGGFCVVRAASLEEAVALAAPCPIFEHGGTVEVRPAVTICGPA